MITKRIDAITKIPADRLKEDAPIPKSVKIEITGRCNYRCSFCALRAREGAPAKDMDFDFFKRIAKEMRDAGVEELGLFYLGESFAAPRLLVNCVRYAKEIGFPYLFLTTNGSLAVPDVVDQVMSAGLNSLKFSINASDIEQFEEVMSVDGRYFQKAIENLRSAWELRQAKEYQCRIYASSIQYDGEQQIKMERLLQEAVIPYVDEHYWLPLYSMGSVATAREAELGYRPIAGNQGRIGALRDPLPCWAVFTEGHITSDGLLSACCFDADGRFAMADLNKMSFVDGWTSDEFRALRRAHISRDVSGTPCAECIAYNSGS